MLRTLCIAGLVGVLSHAAVGYAQEGSVYAMTNALDGNEIAVYDRASDGKLSLREYVATGGRGVGASTEPVDALGTQGPLVLSPDHRWLFAVNAGSDEISVFRVRRNALLLVDKVPSGGHFPASISVHRQLLYVLNSGGDGNISGFTVDHDGKLHALAGSTRSLDVGGMNPPFFLVSPAQVGFNPSGDMLAVTIKGSNELRLYAIGADGQPSQTPVTTLSHGSTPFGFAFNRRGHLVVAEPFGNATVGTPRASAVSSYRVRADGSLELISASIENGQSATCWVGIHSSQRFAFTTNNGSDTVSAFSIDAGGRMSLLDGAAARTGAAPVDLALTPDGTYLYNVNAGSGTVSGYRVQPDGGLEAIGEFDGLPEDAGAVGIVAW